MATWNRAVKTNPAEKTSDGIMKCQNRSFLASDLAAHQHMTTAPMI